MSSDSEQSAQVARSIPDEEQQAALGVEVASASSQRDDISVVSSSQQSIPPTEAPNSPLDHHPSAFKSEPQENPAAAPAIAARAASVLSSSQTPPPSSQIAGMTGQAAPANTMTYLSSQRAGIFSPPATTAPNGLKRESIPPEFAAPTPAQIAEASVEDLRSMLQASLAEQARLKTEVAHYKMEAAHHKLQYNMLSLRAEEDSKRAAVEHEITKKEVQVLQKAEYARQARQDLIAANESAQVKYLQLKVLHERALEEIELLQKKLKAARKILKQNQDEIASLMDEREILLNRIRENREHFHILCSPGGMFYSAVSSSRAHQQAASPQQHRATPRQTPRSAVQRETHREHQNGEGFAVLLQALSQDNNNNVNNDPSVPSTPSTSQRPGAARVGSSVKHTRNVQSTSSLPSTPVSKTRSDGRGGLLPSVDLIPQTEPAYRNARFIPETPATPRGGRERRKSRESTISAEDNQELARQALQSFASRGAGSSGGVPHSHPHPHHQRVDQSPNQRRRASMADDVEVYESQASQAASEMLRRDPRESYEVAQSRDPTPANTTTSSGGAMTASGSGAKLQAKLFGGLNKSGLSTSAAAPLASSSPAKRKLSHDAGIEGGGADARERALMSPTKRLREVGGLRGDPISHPHSGERRVGLGIYGRE
ncbi:3-ketoacyl-CoA thiolase-like protein [Thermochaetoides thermophila DSM 1495]|uniref:3-ketoacyl-CoA thiolase-like protein n=1 Tax=Chaetomium thermophilum (strain DSM 1495 / CBS 144.50 / IMI 039719) TaxID=759272 RepID=G0S995_CHATD|nr:3-ketoacyl-CoA thiolase-like protein [Thermochaetoides thermophila DSM 1495]EGS20006.1 3-ketoacyl-CoA thiolase-like protein [Thermochaetoides thermophila DSM 1495]